MHYTHGAHDTCDADMDIPSIYDAKSNSITVWQANGRFGNHGTIDNPGRDHVGAVVGTDAIDKKRVWRRLHRVGPCWSVGGMKQDMTYLVSKVVGLVKPCKDLGCGPVVPATDKQ